MTPSTLAQRLKDDTQPEHEALEKAMMPMLKASRNREAYCQLLRAMHSYLQPVETAVFKQLGTQELPDEDARRTIALMAADLAQLEATPEPATSAIPVIDSPAAAFGALYVLEGSTLGGQIVGAILRKNLPAELQATRYFDSYGDQTRAMWAAFIGHLNAFGATHPELADTVVRTARDTFALFQQHLQAAQA
ncbi:MAG: hypothetical protein EOP52_06075 [Sphingobacteriales bacterium]|nr:MAG: hypothetical protein EOP52_06075 [Sphingobacteriales bacterium]